MELLRRPEGIGTRLRTLVRVVLGLGHRDAVTIVIDEFPYLLPSTATETDRALSRIQAVLEEDAGRSMTRLILSGSIVAQMTSLFAEHNPLHGRLQPFELRPLAYIQAAPFLNSLDPIQRFERYAICGGVARYLSLLGIGPLAAAVTRSMLSPNAPLWNEGRAVVEQELRQPAMYLRGAASTSDAKASQQPSVPGGVTPLTRSADWGPGRRRRSMPSVFVEGVCRSLAKPSGLVGQ
jgi:hypothetical protein